LIQNDGLENVRLISGTDKQNIAMKTGWLCTAIRNAMDIDFEHALPSAEGPKVCEQGLRPGETEQNPSEGFPTGGLVANEILPSKIRGKGLQDRMIVMSQVLPHPVNA
jgi:hypothetical protein